MYSKWVPGVATLLAFVSACGFVLQDNSLEPREQAIYDKYILDLCDVKMIYARSCESIQIYYHCLADDCIYYF